VACYSDRRRDRYDTHETAPDEESVDFVRSERRRDMTDDETPIVGHLDLSRLSSFIRAPATWLLNRWLGRVVLATAAGMARIEIFDRAMTLAAQFFTSVFPIIIMAASWLGTAEFTQLAHSLDLPPQTRAVLSEALGKSRIDALGLVGALVVLVSATSLSRALTRAFLAVWRLNRGPRRLNDTWRWLAVVLVLALAMMLTRLLVRVVQGLPPRPLWSTAVYFAIDALLAFLAPWLLLAGRVRLRRLIPGGVVFAVLMLLVRPASTVYLTVALQSSAKRYGSIGIAFTYLTWLYVISFTLLMSAVIGQVVASDPGRVGRFLRHS
jgi:membrane protein